MSLSSSSVDLRIPEALLRLYNLLESFFGKSWRPSEIELVN